MKQKSFGKTWDSKLKCGVLLFVGLAAFSANTAKAGEITTTPVHTNQEFVVKKDDTISFTATPDDPNASTVTMTVTADNGATVTTGGANTDIVTFGPSTEGKECTVTVNIDHTKDDGNGGTINCTTNKDYTYTVHVPKVEIEFVQNGEFADYEEAPFQIIVSPGQPSDYTMEFSSEPVLSGSAQNIEGTDLVAEDLGGGAGRIVKCLWFGDTQDTICYTFTAKYEIDATYSYKGVSDLKLAEKQTIDVVLPPEYADAEASISTANNSTAAENAEANPGGSGSTAYRCELKYKDYNKSPSVNVPDIPSQYYDLIVDEEEFHADQLTGEVGYSDGGMGDLWTLKGLKFWLGHDDEQGPYYSYGSTASSAKLFAEADIFLAVTTEREESSSMKSDRNCYSEKKAKLHSGIKEAYILSCAYPWCSEPLLPPGPFDLHPAYQ